MTELWEQGEVMTQRLFNLKPTSGSGRGFHDKQDSKDDNWLAETKTTAKGAYSINFDKYDTWRLNAAKVGKNIMLHIIPIIDDKLREDKSLVVVQAKVFKDLLCQDS